MCVCVCVCGFIVIRCKMGILSLWHSMTLGLDSRGNIPHSESRTTSPPVGLNLPSPPPSNPSLFYFPATLSNISDVSHTVQPVLITICIYCKLCHLCVLTAVTLKLHAGGYNTTAVWDWNREKQTGGTFLTLFLSEDGLSPGQVTQARLQQKGHPVSVSVSRQGQCVCGCVCVGGGASTLGGLR